MHDWNVCFFIKNFGTFYETIYYFFFSIPNVSNFIKYWYISVFIILIFLIPILLWHSFLWCYDVIFVFFHIFLINTEELRKRNSTFSFKTNFNTTNKILLIKAPYSKQFISHLKIKLFGTESYSDLMRLKAYCCVEPTDF